MTGPKTSGPTQAEAMRRIPLERWESLKAEADQVVARYRELAR